MDHAIVQEVVQHYNCPELTASLTNFLAVLKQSPYRKRQHKYLVAYLILKNTAEHRHLRLDSFCRDFDLYSTRLHIGKALNIVSRTINLSEPVITPEAYFHDACVYYQCPYPSPPRPNIEPRHLTSRVLAAYFILEKFGDRTDILAYLEKVGINSKEARRAQFLQLHLQNIDPDPALHI